MDRQNRLMERKILKRSQKWFDNSFCFFTRFVCFFFKFCCFFWGVSLFSIRTYSGFSFVFQHLVSLTRSCFSKLFWLYKILCFFPDSSCISIFHSVLFYLSSSLFLFSKFFCFLRDSFDQNSLVLSRFICIISDYIFFYKIPSFFCTFCFRFIDWFYQILWLCQILSHPAFYYAILCVSVFCLVFEIPLSDFEILFILQNSLVVSRFICIISDTFVFFNFCFSDSFVFYEILLSLRDSLAFIKFFDCVQILSHPSQIFSFSFFFFCLFYEILWLFPDFSCFLLDPLFFRRFLNFFSGFFYFCFWDSFLLSTRFFLIFSRFSFIKLFRKDSFECFRDSFYFTKFWVR